MQSAAAYGWPVDITNDEALRELLALNGDRCPPRIPSGLPRCEADPLPGAFWCRGPGWLIAWKLTWCETDPTRPRLRRLVHHRIAERRCGG